LLLREEDCPEEELLEELFEELPEALLDEELVLSEEELLVE
jgi:hypothetical protein